MEKYFDVRTGKMKVKSRPVLIVGYEPDYTSHTDIDYEVLPISTLKNRRPSKDYDYLIDEELRQKLNLNEICYVRSHKTSWSHVKNMDVYKPIGNLIENDFMLFNEILNKNKEWVSLRTQESLFEFESLKESG